MEILKKINITYIIVALILSGGIAIYGYLNYSHKQDQLELERQKQRIEAKEREEAEIKKATQNDLYEDCLKLAYDNYKENWDIRVKHSGRNDNLLPRSLSDDLEESRQIEEELCVKKFK